LEESYEVEVKLPITDKEAMKKTIIQAGGVALGSESQVDIYYDHPCRSFSKTDESVRVRHRTRFEGTTITESEPVPIELTYKGPKVDKTTQTRIEYTVCLDEKEMESMAQILLNTSFKHVATVAKHRELFDIRGITATLDVVTDIGCFIEFELMADGKKEMTIARNRILELVKDLGLNEKDMMRVSYLELYLENSS
jgi:adenylate cyclase class 2